MAKKDEWIIGREGDIVVNNKYVSRTHALLTRDAEGFHIEDLGSTGGTYVNDVLVNKKKISEKDKVVLGKNYTLNILEALKQIPLSDEEFAEAFDGLQDVYDTYNRTKVKIQSKTQSKMMIKRTLPMAIPGLVAVGASFSSEIGPIVGVIGGICSAIALVIGSLWGAKEIGQMPEKLLELDEKFKIDYSCPACYKPFGAVPWESLRRQGQCPWCKRSFTVKK